MELHGVGEAIFYYREQFKLSQLQICKGICSIATLSRLESGDREADSLMSETLLGRLGKSANRFEFVLNDEDYYLYNLRYQIEKADEDGNIKGLMRLLKEYSNSMPQKQILHKQFLNFYYIRVMIHNNTDIEKIYAAVRNTLYLTRPDYEEKTNDTMLFSPIEMRLIYNMLTCSKDQDGSEFGEDNLFNALFFAEYYYSQEQKERLMLPFFYSIAINSEKNDDLKRVIKYAEKGINIIAEGSKYSYLPDFYFLKAKSLEALFVETDKWKVMKNGVLEDCVHAYYIEMFDGNHKKMNKIKKFCEERLKCRITEQGIL